MKKINADIKNQTFEKVYLLFGEDEYLKSNCKNRLKQALSDGDSMNFKAVTGKDISLPELRDFTDTMPFFADRRVLMLEDTGLFKNASEGYDEWIDGLADYAVVVFTESEVDKRNRLYKKVRDKGYVSEMKHPDEEMIGKWILQKCGQSGLNVTRDAYRRLIEVLGNDMESISHEVQKLCDYASDRGNITLDDVNAVVTPVVNSRIFEMVENIALGRQERSLTLYYDLIALREPPMRILYLITRQLNQMMLTKEMNALHKSRDEIAAVLGVKPFVAGKLSDQARAFSMKTLKEAVGFSAEAEEAVKSGNLNENMAVEMMIFMMTSKK